MRPAVCGVWVPQTCTPLTPKSGLSPTHPKGSAGSHRTVAGLCPGRLASRSPGVFFFFFTGKTNTEVCPVFQSASRLPGDYSWAAGSKGHSAAELKFLLGSDWRLRPISHSGVYCTATWRTPGKLTDCGCGRRLFGKQENKQEDPKTEIWTEIKINCS